jgi:hypothetical protein
MGNKILSSGKQHKLNVSWNRKMEKVCMAVNDRRNGVYETRSILGKLIIAPLLLLIKPVFRHRYEKLSGISGKTFKELIQPADQVGSGHCKTPQLGHVP